LRLAGGGPGNERFVPAEAAARAALDAALADWRSGQPPGRIERVNPPAQVIDTHRAPGQRLVDFEVLGSVPGVAPRCYAVRLVLDEPAEEIRARYIVVGINPLWVFRHEDYDMLAHWDHVMPNEEQQHTAAGGKGGSPEGGIP
jgi:hypothetical protein